MSAAGSEAYDQNRRKCSKRFIRAKLQARLLSCQVLMPASQLVSAVRQHVHCQLATVPCGCHCWAQWSPEVAFHSARKRQWHCDTASKRSDVVPSLPVPWQCTQSHDLAWQGLFEEAADELTSVGAVLDLGLSLAAGLLHSKLLSTLQSHFLWQACHPLLDVNHHIQGRSHITSHQTHQMWPCHLQRSCQSCLHAVVPGHANVCQIKPLSMHAWRFMLQDL